MREKILADASVLIALEKLEILHLLCEVYSEIWITTGVNKEFGQISLSCLKIKHISNSIVIVLIKELNLGTGEAEVIALANESKTKVLIDDMKARRIAENLGLSVSGTIGFLLIAMQMNLIDSAYRFALRLRETGFYLSDNLLNEVKKYELRKKDY